MQLGGSGNRYSQCAWQASATHTFGACNRNQSFSAPHPPPTVTADAAEKPKGRFSEMLESSRQTLDQWQHAIDERVRAILPGVSALQVEVKTLTQRVEALEKRLSMQEEPAQGEPAQTEGAKE